MKNREFARKMNAQAPSLESLVRLGMSEAEADDLRRGFLIPPLTESRSFEGLPNEISSLFGEYDLSKTEIGLLIFSDCPKVRENLIVIGDYDGDPVVVDLDDGRISVRERNGWETELWAVAASLSGFLGAISYIGGALSERIFDDALYSSIDANMEIAKEASKLSGSTDSIDLFKNMLGV